MGGMMGANPMMQMLMMMGGGMKPKMPHHSRVKHDV
jgi:hypothetical protein